MLADLLTRRSVTRDWHRFYPVTRALILTAVYAVILAILGVSPRTGAIFVPIVLVLFYLTGRNNPSHRRWAQVRKEAEEAVRQNIDASLTRLYGDHLGEREAVYAENEVHMAVVDGDLCETLLVFGDRGATARYLPPGAKNMVEVPRADLRDASKP